MSGWGPGQPPGAPGWGSQPGHAPPQGGPPPHHANPHTHTQHAPHAQHAHPHHAPQQAQYAQHAHHAPQQAQYAQHAPPMHAGFLGADGVDEVARTALWAKRVSWMHYVVGGLSFLNKNVIQAALAFVVGSTYGKAAKSLEAVSHTPHYGIPHLVEGTRHMASALRTRLWATGLVIVVMLPLVAIGLFVLVMASR